MGDIFLYMLFGVLTMIGVFTVIQAALRWSGRKRLNENMAALIFLRGREEEVEAMVRDLDSERKWGGIGESCRLVLVDCGIDQETGMLCELCCQSFSETYLCRPEELEDFLPWKKEEKETLE